MLALSKTGLSLDGSTWMSLPESLRDSRYVRGVHRQYGLKLSR